MERTESVPMDLTEIIKRAWNIYKEHFFILLGIVAVLTLPSTLFGLYFNRWSQDFMVNLMTNPDPSELLGLFKFMIPYLIYMLAVTPASIGALVKVASEGFLGRKISFLEAYKTGLHNYFAILVPMILSGLLVFFGTFFGLILLIIGSLVAFIFLQVSLVFIVQSVIVDEKKYFSAMSRSARLVLKDFWRVLGILIVFLLINLVVSLLLNIPGFLPVAVLGRESLVAILFSGIFSFLGTLLVTPFSYSAITVLYYDLKIRQEGFTVEESSLESPVLE